MNRYWYAGGDPVNRRDPSGLDDLTDDDVSGDLCDGPCFVGGPPIDLPGDDGFDVGDSQSLSDFCLTALGQTQTDPYDVPVCGGLVPIQLFGGPPGGGKGVKFSVSNYSRTGPNEQLVASVLSKISAQALTGDCGSWLTGNDFNASQFISAIMGSGPSDYTFGTANFSGSGSATTAAFVGNANSDGSPVPGLPTNSSITVNNNGAFFNSGYSIGGLGVSYVGGTLQAQAFILIHELAHEVGAAGMQPDAGNPSAETNNNNLVQQHCGSQMSGLQ
jgi:hypothetical protein